MVKGKRAGGEIGTPETAPGSGTPPKRPRKGASDPVEKINTGAGSEGEEPAGEPPASAGEGPEIEESAGLKMAETLKGDIRDRILRLVADMPGKWSTLNEKAQTDFSERAELIAERIIYSAIEIIHAEGAPSLRMVVDGVNFKKGLKATLSGMRGEPYRHLLADQTEHEVLIVIDAPSRFMGERAPAPIEKDQRELSMPTFAAVAAAAPVDPPADDPPTHDPETGEIVDDGEGE